jgi:hypothetical protein
MITTLTIIFFRFPWKEELAPAWLYLIGVVDRVEDMASEVRSNHGHSGATCRCPRLGLEGGLVSVLLTPGAVPR